MLSAMAEAPIAQDIATSTNSRFPPVGRKRAKMVTRGLLQCLLSPRYQRAVDVARKALASCRTN